MHIDSPEDLPGSARILVVLPNEAGDGCKPEILHQSHMEEPTPLLAPSREANMLQSSFELCAKPMLHSGVTSSSCHQQGHSTSTSRSTQMLCSDMSSCSSSQQGHSSSSPSPIPRFRYVLWMHFMYGTWRPAFFSILGLQTNQMTM